MKGSNGRAHCTVHGDRMRFASQQAPAVLKPAVGLPVAPDPTASTSGSSASGPSSAAKAADRLARMGPRRATTASRTAANTSFTLRGLAAACRAGGEGARL